MQYYTKSNFASYALLEFSETCRAVILSSPEKLNLLKTSLGAANHLAHPIKGSNSTAAIQPKESSRFWGERMDEIEVFSMGSTFEEYFIF